MTEITMSEVTNSVIVERIDVLTQKVDKINGSVAGIQKWRYMLTGGFIVSNIIIVPIVIALILKSL